MSVYKSVSNIANGIEVETSDPSPRWVTINYNGESLRLGGHGCLHDLIYAAQRCLDEIEQQENRST